METSITGLELTVPIATESQRAWHLAALLLSIGRRTRAAVLASRCTLFAASSDLVEFLCSIPNSPILLTSDLYVTLSPVVLIAFREFVLTSNLIGSCFQPRIGAGVHSTTHESSTLLRTYTRKRKRNVHSDGGFMPVAKRGVVLNSRNAHEVDQLSLPSPKRIRYCSSGINLKLNEDVIRSTYMQPSGISLVVDKMMLTPLLFLKSSVTNLTFKSETTDSLDSQFAKDVLVLENMARDSYIQPALPLSTLEIPDVCNKDQFEEIDFETRPNVNFRIEDIEERNISSVETSNVNVTCEALDIGIIGKTRVLQSEQTQLSVTSASMKLEGNFFPPFASSFSTMQTKSDIRMINKEYWDMKHLQGKPTTENVESKAISSKTDLSAAHKQLSKLPSTSNTIHRDAMAPRRQNFGNTSEHNKNIDSLERKQHLNRGQTSTAVVKKLQQNSGDLLIKKRRGMPNSIYPEDQQGPKMLPEFESYIVENEEGSGGYGTVYKARQKSDGVTVAIKCPHADVRRQLVSNELRMLERFGGKNFIIKYKNCFKNGNSDCFVLQHVEHDRPEVLKKEIDVSQLRWYGYCMFRALASLHKEGVVHRDIKPGNFLFSRKANKGYLIDFNLALDLHHKNGSISKSKQGYVPRIDPIRLPTAKSLSPTKSRKLPEAKSSEVVNPQTKKGSKLSLDPNYLKRKTLGRLKTNDSSGSWKVIKSQGGDCSGITSVKDVTSARNSSAERLRQPLPCKGRKELINLLQEAVRSSNQEASSVPSSMRKRVAAPHRKLDNKLVCITPMPLHSTVIGSTSSGLVMNKGDDKHNREGVCVGTKGFRAPEVLFRSRHQGPKVDIWSAGVTLLYLIIGRTPFTGDPEQNIKDIAKLRGSEDLWEIAKLHNRESSFPVDLYNTQALPSVTLRDWCVENNRRPDFLQLIPGSLFDLVDKCLTVNPRLRISAEEALKHEFFAPCHESLRKQRLCRQGFGLDSGTSKTSSITYQLNSQLEPQLRLS
ncbi:Kinase like protein [Quillaja saponaria]|uniref:non-specific serine/threonine protein kinase n=1 Tax=Quillaja saponaria TaxID=32244 RepID=A0AAD7L6R5_QUISA|nr:Kinase like protein [Quillaja saponaria]